MKSQRGWIDDGLFITLLMVALCLGLLATVSYYMHVRSDCIKANAHRAAAEVQVICGGP